MKRKFLILFRSKFKSFLKWLFKVSGYEVIFLRTFKSNLTNIKRNNKVVIEVGGNFGTDTFAFIKKGYDVFCFEPVPELCVVLQKNFSKYKNFHLIQMAVDTKENFRNFNISKATDWGVSSLYNFQRNINKKWKNRPDFFFEEKIQVPTIRLDTFMKIYKLKKNITYLWIDAQGNDLNVLKSLGNFIYHVKNGKCEASLKTILYSKNKNTFKNVNNFLLKKKFKTKAVPDRDSNECDIYFSKN
tara:strand:- start:109 stop:837 length:729 start_codon:yes stop_codon:yes gene_type:complete